ncbi:MAG: DUF4157 domain-containing protein [Methanosarcinales archaeon]|nr:DUF4157 domain-containing protein [Methanosarcinales archaeon]
MQSMDTPVDRILFLQKTAGNQAVSRLMKSGALQAKLRIGQPGVVYEQEADRVADAVMRMPEPRVWRQPEEEKKKFIQTKPLGDQITLLVQRQVEPEEEDEEKGHDRRVYSIIHEVLSKTGGGVEDARIELVRRRQENPMDPYLAAAEHYMYARSYVAKEGWFDWIKMIYASEGYYVFKKIMYAVGAEEHIPKAGKATPTPPSRMAVRWGKEGASDGLVDYKKRQRPNEYRECLFTELERDGGVPSEAEVIEAVEKCSEKTGYPAPHVPEEGAHEYLERVKEGYGGQGDIPIQPKQVRGCTPGVTPEVEFRIHAMKGSGQHLPESMRAFFEPRFDYDFSQVRIHTDGRSAETVQAVNARAFIVGKDVVFGAGQYTSGTARGRRLGIVYDLRNGSKCSSQRSNTLRSMIRQLKIM